MNSISRQLLNAQQESKYLNPKAIGFRDHQFNGVLAALVSGEHLLAHQLLLALDLADNQEHQLDALWLQLQIAWQLNQRVWFQKLLSALVKQAPPFDLRCRHALLQITLWRDQKLTPNGFIADQPLTDGVFPHLDLCILQSWCDTNRLNEVMSRLYELRIGSCVEALLIEAHCLCVKNDWEAAECLLLKHMTLYAHRWEFVVQLLNCQFQLQREDSIIPTMRKLFPFHKGREWPFLDRLVQARLLQRHPSSALRLKLLERLTGLAGEAVSEPDTILPAYEMLGRPNWLRYLHPSVASRPDLYMNLHSNWLMILSSTVSDIYPIAAMNLAKTMQIVVKQQLPALHFRPGEHDASNRKLRIGWICGDIGNHPVSRFLLAWLTASDSFLHYEHHVIATCKPAQNSVDMFSKLDNVQFNDISPLRSLPAQTVAIHALHLDVAIDLNGWTGNNIAPAFIARLAPVQVNYLAFHASSGIPSMDYWLVDDALVAKSPFKEWHTEKLYRLSRPFIAWQPTSFQVEGQISVCASLATANESIRFGCFNNLRKISDKALRLWSSLLKKIPNSVLVLKSYSKEDTASAELMRRRIQRCGLIEEQITWLAYASSPEDHLAQYAQMDVALDSFPNTGCTTTCEALWMGVPVITLEGQHYVSRMASAVLRGANLDDWIVTTEEDYLQLAIVQSLPQRLAWLRNNRQHWREKLRQSPLGDATDLMKHLELAFKEMYLERSELLNISSTPGVA